MANGNGVEVSAPGGWAIKASGSPVVFFLSVATVLGVLGYDIHLSTQQTLWMTEMQAHTAIIIKNQGSIVQMQQNIIDGQTHLATSVLVAQEQMKDLNAGVIYVLSLTPADREKLRLQVPDSIRRLERR